MRHASIIPTLAGVLALIIGSGVMLGFMTMRRTNAITSDPESENALRVEALRVYPEDVPITIVGYGQVHVLRNVSIAPEVSGRVVTIHPNLIAGGIVPKGDLLIAIDDEPYHARVDDAESTVAQLEAAVARLCEERKNEQARLESMNRARDIAHAQYERLQQLLVEDVGTESDVDRAEAAYVASRDDVDKLTHQLNLYPIRINEAQFALDSAKSRLELARLDLSKTRICSPFDARVKHHLVEQDQFVTAGVDIVELADDSVLEISVSLDSRDARRWLQFREQPSANGAGWFGVPEPVECIVQWTEDVRAQAWKGTLDRVERFDEASRTLTVAVRLRGSGAANRDSDQLPLVDGMFCRVEIPGRAMTKVYALPQSAVSIDSSVFTAVDNRLKTAKVDVLRQHDSLAYVSGGLESGDLVVTTRLVNPLDHTLLDISILPVDSP